MPKVKNTIYLSKLVMNTLFAESRNSDVIKFQKILFKKLNQHYSLINFSKTAIKAFKQKQGLQRNQLI